MRQSRLILFTKYFLDFMFWSGIVAVASLPYILKLAGTYYFDDFREHYYFMLIILFISGMCGIIIVYQLRKMMKSVVKKDCFIIENIRSLKVMGHTAFVIAVMFVVKVIVLPAPAGFVIILTFFIAGIFSHVLSLVFEEAVRYKEENDLTI